MSSSSTSLSPANPAVVHAYSELAAAHYEHPTNRSFAYGDITARFLSTIAFRPADRTILDIGCGTGFAFDLLRGQFDPPGRRGIGIDPARGMLDRAVAAFRGDPRFSFREGAFERIPLPDRAVDRIVSTFALHWVRALPDAAVEMRRVLRDEGAVDLCMAAREDGRGFKRAVRAALARHLRFGQLRAAALLARRASAADLASAMAPFADRFTVEAVERRALIHGSFDDHMRWWTARSAALLAEVADRVRFMADLRGELELLATPRGIPFDAAWLELRIRPR